MHRHNWGPWEKAKATKRRFNNQNELMVEYEVIVQERRCEKCGRIQVESLGLEQSW